MPRRKKNLTTGIESSIIDVEESGKPIRIGRKRREDVADQLAGIGVETAGVLFRGVDSWLGLDPPGLSDNEKTMLQVYVKQWFLSRDENLDEVLGKYSNAMLGLVIGALLLPRMIVGWKKLFRKPEDEIPESPE